MFAGMVTISRYVAGLIVMVTDLVLPAGTASIAAWIVVYLPVPSAATVGGPEVGLLLGLALALGLVDGLALGRALAVGLALAEGLPLGDVTPVHVTPLSAKVVGDGLLAVNEALKPKLTLALVGIDAL